MGITEKRMLLDLILLDLISSSQLHILGLPVSVGSLLNEMVSETLFKVCLELVKAAPKVYRRKEC